MAMIPEIVPVSYPNRMPPKARENKSQTITNQGPDRRSSVPENADITTVQNAELVLTPSPEPPGPPPIVVLSGVVAVEKKMGACDNDLIKG
jgi:hypothetical protein